MSRRPARIPRRMTLLDLTAFFFCAFVLTKPYYILPSGSFQIGDLCLMLAFLSFVLHKGLGFQVERRDRLLVDFVMAVVVINCVYFCVYGSWDFVSRSSFYVFNLFAVLLARQFLDGPMLRRTAILLRVDLVIQVLVCVLGLGRDYDESRYMGTFNDPNQLAFFVFASFLMIQVITKNTGARRCYVDDVACIYLVFESGSTGMFLGVCLIYLVKAIEYVGSGKRGRYSVLSVAVAVVVIVGTGIFATGVFATNNGEIRTGNQQIDFAIQRVGSKMAKLSNSGEDYDSSILIDRGLDKVVLYPEKLLYGAGEGEFSRFSLANADNEVHSTIIGIAFYYGIVPFCLLLAWLVKSFKGVKGDVLLLYIPLLIECLTLANQRQPFVWILIVIASVQVADSSIINSEVEESRNEGLSAVCESSVFIRAKHCCFSHEETKA